MPQTSAAAFKPRTGGYLHPFFDGSRFWYGVGEKPRTIVELAMCSLSAALRSSTNWSQERLDERITDKWMHEHVGMARTVESPSGPVDVILNRHQVQYVIDELAGYSALRDTDNHCEVACFERIWRSDSLFSSDFLSSFDADLQRIRSVDADESTTRDIISPDAFPVVYGRSLYRSPSGQLQSVPKPVPPLMDGYAVSTRFTYLPTTFSISTFDKSLTCHAMSYINNLHPDHVALYSQVEHALARSVPLFEHVLTDLHRDNPLYQRIIGSCKYTEWDEPEEPEHSDDEEGWANYEREMRTWALQRPIAIPDVPENGYEGGLEERRTMINLRGRLVTVLVKVSDIRLTPERPHYRGTSWNVIGMRNEQIVACVYHCVYCDNVTPPALAFRMPICSPRKFTAGDEGATARTWGLRHGSPSIQSLGQVELNAGRSVAFPNIYQHALQPFSLIDPENEGRVTLLCFSLADPALSADDEVDEVSEILTTSSVPPQQKAWVKQALEESLDVRIPHEVVERILDFVEGVMTDEEAAQVAAQMKQDREWFRISHARYWFNLPFDVWFGEYNV